MEQDFSYELAVFRRTEKPEKPKESCWADTIQKYLAADCNCTISVHHKYIVRQSLSKIKEIF